jgi:uncharacterized protein
MWSVGQTPGRIRALIWRTVDGQSMEHLELIQPVPETIHFNGMVISAQNGKPSRSFYWIQTNAQWFTQQMHVRFDEAMLELVVRDGRWYSVRHDLHEHKIIEHELPDLQGCIDVDLGLTPATNTLPIRRLKLEIGQEATITAAWVQFPSLKVVPLQQRYTRLSETSYRYSNEGFEALLEVDELGLVVQYEGYWERIAVD